MAGRKFLRNNAGAIQEEISIDVSAGAGDASKLVAVNASGFLDSTIVNSKTTSAGAGDSGKLPALDSTGRLDTSFMPTGIGPDTAAVVTSEALAAGDWVNIHNVAGAFRARKADGTTSGKEKHGFVLAAFASAATATVYFEGTNAQVTGQTPGVVFLSTTAGLGTATAPSASGNVVQRIGFATSATAVNSQSQTPIVLA